MNEPAPESYSDDEITEALRSMRCPRCNGVLTEYGAPKEGQEPGDVRTFFCGAHGEDAFVVSVLGGALEALAGGEA